MWVALALGALLVWAGLDLYGPARTDIRAFDPREVARLDTAMWRTYYDRRPIPLFFQLAELLRKQFHFPLLRSFVAAATAARATFVFKDGHERADYLRALPDLERYYGAIRKMSIAPFDARHTAELELEWWIVHRQRASHSADDLPRALADASAALYGVPRDSLLEYGRLRTDAMNIRDTTAAAGGVTEGDWQRIEVLLQDSWKSLWTRVQATGRIGRF